MAKNPRLKRALDALSKERQRVQRDMHLVNERRKRMSAAIGRLDQCREAIGSTPTIDAAGRFDRYLFLVAREAEARMTREMAELDGRLQHFDREITDPVQQRLWEANQRERAVDTLLERRRQAERLELEKGESLALDEFAQRRWQASRRNR